MSMRGQSALLDWEEDEVSGPDVMRRETLLLLAKMTSNTYFEPHKGGWYNLTDEWNVVRRPLSASRVDAHPLYFW
jgi:putative lipase involved disintegration of autophagic bodies